MIRAGVSVDEARGRIAEADGFVRRAIGDMTNAASINQ
jgi:hypothetical protein